jgi:hypothetical protein
MYAGMTAQVQAFLAAAALDSGNCSASEGVRLTPASTTRSSKRMRDWVDPTAGLHARKKYPASVKNQISVL